VQTAVLFFAPLAVAAAHSLVILLMVDNIHRSTLFPAFGLVTLAYLLLHGSYFLVTRQAYMKAVII
jgi:hypothetical protein